ncbi:PREDICTED: putative isocitrate dehydrogenase [NAD] subunit-like 4 isoform X2 [Camelina sativa]|uniref:Isocitrate dehydrogenase [NAD] subunit-like 4 isoform X2 n=1 Tax=Camelina sativa TaxID=90675 RepID=A0ABM0X052_CAMSA|nr:PREDICTED: putative isocitrate dehydrogenase [NAD] subunit-like 4 isoform X2 [Camelina sativa]
MSHQSISLLKNLSKITTGSAVQTRFTTYMPRPVTVIHSNVTNAVHQVLEAMHAPVYFETYDIMGNMNHFPREVVESILRNKVCLDGRLKTSLCAGKREELDLFASLVNCFNLNGQPSRHQKVDIVVIRESTEGGYAGREHEVVPGVIENFQVTMTKFWSDRIAKYAFEYARLSQRKKVTAVHNKGKLADAFFLKSCQEAAKLYPSITYGEISVNKCCLQLVEKPERFDIIVTPNLYGNLIINIAAGVAGGGSGEIMPGGSFGAEYAIFEQVGSVGNHKSPVALLFSSVMMLRHLQVPLFADRLKTAMIRVATEGKCGNSDTSTQEIVDDVIANMD